jgi:hypothetical protein
MSSINLEVFFEGLAAKSGTIDARLLADSLIGYSEVFARTNAMVNGEASEAGVLVQSEFKAGSFIAGLELVQNIAEQARHLITSHPFLDATGLATLIGFITKNRALVKDSLLDLYKWLKGKKPERAVQVGNNDTEITFGQNKKTVTNVVFNLYSDEAIRAALGRLTSPLRNAAIDRIAMKQDGTEQSAIEKSEAEYFEADPLELTSDSSEMEGQRETVLIVSKLSFVEGSTWTFLEKGATVVAKIDDADFWQQVHEHKVTFGEGDRLRVLLRWRVIQSRNKKLVPKNTIQKVYEVLPRPVQLRLDSKNDDVGAKAPVRRIRLED